MKKKVILCCLVTWATVRVMPPRKPGVPRPSCAQSPGTHPALLFQARKDISCDTRGVWVEPPHPWPPAGAALKTWQGVRPSVDAWAGPVSRPASP